MFSVKWQATKRWVLYDLSETMCHMQKLHFGAFLHLHSAQLSALKFDKIWQVCVVLQDKPILFKGNP